MMELQEAIELAEYLERRKEEYSYSGEDLRNILNSFDDTLSEILATVECIERKLNFIKIPDEESNTIKDQEYY